MQDLLGAIQAVNRNVDSRFGTLQSEFQGLRSELTQLKLEMVTRAQFETLESRVFALESNVVSAENPDVKFLQMQLERLDPAHKCLSLIGFKGADANARGLRIEEFLRTHFESLAARLRIEHVFKGKWNERVLGGISLVEFPTKKDRDDALQRIKSGNLSLMDGGETIRFAFAKTKKQLHRNFCVKKAVELLKQDSRSRGKEVVDEWKCAEKGKRTVSVEGQVCFVQNASDMSGRFLEPYAHLHFE